MEQGRWPGVVWAAFGVWLAFSVGGCFGDVVQGGAGGPSTFTYAVDGGSPVSYTHTPNAAVPRFGADPFVGFAFDPESNAFLVRAGAGYDTQNERLLDQVYLAFRGSSAGTYQLTHDQENQVYLSYSDGTWVRRARQQTPGTAAGIEVTSLQAEQRVAGTFTATVGNPLIGLRSLTGSFDVAAADLAALKLPSAAAPGDAPTLYQAPALSQDSATTGDIVSVGHPAQQADTVVIFMGPLVRGVDPFYWSQSTSSLADSTLRIPDMTPSGLYFPQFALLQVDGKRVDYYYDWLQGDGTYAVDGGDDFGFRAVTDFPVPFLTVTCPGEDYAVLAYSTGTQKIALALDVFDSLGTRQAVRTTNYIYSTGGLDLWHTGITLCLVPGTYYFQVRKTSGLGGSSGAYSLLVSRSAAEYDGTATGETAADNDPADDSLPAQGGTPNVLVLEVPQTHTLTDGTDQTDTFRLTVP